jgi:hypothetical protein
MKHPGQICSPSNRQAVPPISEEGARKGQTRVREERSHRPFKSGTPFRRGHASIAEGGVGCHWAATGCSAWGMWALPHCLAALLVFCVMGSAQRPSGAARSTQHAAKSALPPAEEPPASTVPTWKVVQSTLNSAGGGGGEVEFRVLPIGLRYPCVFRGETALWSLTVRRSMWLFRMQIMTHVHARLHRITRSLLIEGSHNTLFVSEEDCKSDASLLFLRCCLPGLEFGNPIVEES